MKLVIILLSLFIVSIYGTKAQNDFSDSERTKLILLGTGNPNPNPSKSGPSIAIVVNNEAYIIDFGPGRILQADYPLTFLGLKTP
ncbi:MAG: hypothetical protein RLO12_14510 [Fulvivirga sp.]